MKVARTVAAIRAWHRTCPGNVVLVPTMGALHIGHASLIAQARRIAGKTGRVVVSIFVNPTQFGPREDFSAYPRPIRSDLRICRANGADAVFLPPVEAMYAVDSSVSVEEALLSSGLCGASRPGHFRGVCTVVAKLFNLTRPTHAIFGEKDWQQLAVLRRMVRDLNFPIRVIGHPTVREPDGLAVSSRNSYLTPAERAVAPGFHAALSTAARLTSPQAVVRLATKLVGKIPGARLDYLEAVEAESLRPLKSRRTEGRLAAALFLGRARLIDNIPLPRIAKP